MATLKITPGWYFSFETQYLFTDELVSAFQSSNTQAKAVMATYPHRVEPELYLRPLLHHRSPPA